MARTQLIGLMAMLLGSIGLASMVFVLGLHPQGAVRKALIRYTEDLDVVLRFVRSNHRGIEVLMWQVVVSLLLLAVAFLGAPIFALLILGVVLGPYFELKRKQQARVERVEQQLDTWLLALANALKAVPSLGDAFISSQALTHAPIAEELDLVIKEYRLGTALDEAMAHMSKRLGSRVVSTALLTLQIARRSGGDVPATLETAAANLREMARLEGVVRSKTADGRNQAWAVGALPLLVVGAMYFFHPDLFDPLLHTTTGHVVLGIAAMLWIGAIALSRAILKVDI